MTDDVLKIIAEKADLTLEHMRILRAGQERLEHKIDELRAGQIALRSDVHGLKGDLLRQERALAAVEVDIDRIHARLGLIDQPQ